MLENKNKTLGNNESGHDLLVMFQRRISSFLASTLRVKKFGSYSLYLLDCDNFSIQKNVVSYFFHATEHIFWLSKVV